MPRDGNDKGDDLREKLRNFRPGEGPFPLLSIAELDCLPEPVWLIDQILSEDGFAAIYGMPKSLKTFTAISMMLSLATGVEWCGRPTVPTRVVYICAEGVPRAKKRLQAWQNKYGIDCDIASFRIIPMRVNLMNRGEVDWLKETIKAYGGGGGDERTLLVVDTFARCMVGGDEDKAKDIAVVVAELDDVRREVGQWSVLLVHHCGKNEARGMRGSIALFGALDTVLHCKRNGMTVDLEIEAQKDGKDGYSIQLSAEEDEQSESLVIVSASSSEMVDDGPPTELEKKGLVVLRNLVNRDGQQHAAGGGKMVRAVTVKAWRAKWRELYRKAVSDDRGRAEDEPVKKEINRASAGMVSKGLVGKDSKFMWLREGGQGQEGDN